MGKLHKHSSHGLKEPRKFENLAIYVISRGLSQRSMTWEPNTSDDRIPRLARFLSDAPTPHGSIEIAHRIRTNSMKASVLLLLTVCLLHGLSGHTDTEPNFGKDADLFAMVAVPRA